MAPTNRKGLLPSESDLPRQKRGSTTAVYKHHQPFALPNINGIPGQPIFDSEPLPSPVWIPNTEIIAPVGQGCTQLPTAGVTGISTMTAAETPQYQPDKPLKKARTRLPDKPTPGIGYRRPKKPLVLLANNPLCYNEKNNLLGPSIIQAACGLTEAAPFSTSDLSQLTIPAHIRCPPFEIAQLRCDLIRTGITPVGTFGNIHEAIHFLITGDLPSVTPKSDRRLCTAILDTPGSVAGHAYVGEIEHEELDELDKEILALAGDKVE